MSITCSAFTASITAPGPTGRPAARNARAKPTTLSANCSVCSGARWLMAMVVSIPSSFRGATNLVLARRVLQHLLQGVALHPRDIVLVLQERAQRVADHLRGQRAGIELGERGRPVDGLGHARRLVEILVAQSLDEAH